MPYVTFVLISNDCIRFIWSISIVPIIPNIKNRFLSAVILHLVYTVNFFKL